MELMSFLQQKHYISFPLKVGGEREMVENLKKEGNMNAAFLFTPGMWVRGMQILALWISDIL